MNDCLHFFKDCLRKQQLMFYKQALLAMTLLRVHGQQVIILYDDTRVPG